MKLLKSEAKMLEEYGSGLGDAAKAELKRLWLLRDKYTAINEATLPTLVQYCAVAIKVQDLTFELDAAEDDELMFATDQIGKLQKVMIAYMKLLHLDEKVVTKPKNKFAEILLK